jgi:hypothetical protein
MSPALDGPALTQDEVVDASHRSSIINVASFFTVKVCTMQNAVTLERWRLAFIVLFILIAVLAFGDYAKWWHIDGSSFTADPLWQQRIRALARCDQNKCTA